MVDLRDPRVDSWPLMYSIWPTTFICVAYVYLVKVVGPKFMEKREPYNIKKIMIVYNLFQTLFSFWMFKESWRLYVTGDYSWQCEPVDYSVNPESHRVLILGWWYFISKFIDLLDTVFFIARKKFGQVSSLHVIHHSTLPFLSWWGPRFIGGGNTIFGPFLNSGVHTVMYLYYLLSAMGPEVQKYLWWKKYLTTLQLVQFTMVFFHAIQPLFIECDYPRAATMMFAGTGIQYFILFTAFYKRTYKKSPVQSMKENTVSTLHKIRKNSVEVLEELKKSQGKTSSSVSVFSGKSEKED